jgi:transmembrane sensor
MEEKQFLEVLVKRYINNNLKGDELEAFFHLLKQRKLDAILDSRLEQEQYHQQNRWSIITQTRLLGLHPSTLRIAASLILMFGFGLLAVFNRATIASFIYEYRMVSVETGKNEKKRILLSDGSFLWLNESSKIKYPADFEPNERKVILVEGEVYFDIKKDEKRPFLVQATGTTTKVLGTAFNIRSYSYLKNVQVTVTRGKVAVEQLICNNTKKVTKVLLPNEQVNVNLQTSEIKKVAVNSANSVAWTAGKLLFDNEPLGDILAVIGNKFDVRFTVSDEGIKNYRTSAEFVYTDSLDHILELLSMANNLNYSISNGDVMVMRKQKSINNNMPM